MRFIDAHVHVWTSDLSHYPLAAGFKRENMMPRSFTPEALFKHTRANGVDRVNLIQMSYYGFNNSYMLDMIDLHKDVFVGTAVIDPLGKAPEREMADLSKRRVRAFRIQPRMSKQPIERWLQPEGYARMFEAGAKHNLAMSCLIDPDALPELERMCKKFPDTPVIIDHICRIGAGPKEEINEKDVKALCAMAAHKRVMVKIGAFYALGKKAPPYTDLAPLIQEVVNSYGARRCMWESDSPFQVQDKHTYRDSIDLVRTRLKFLTDADREWLLRRTAEEFFFRGK
jgi:predicted TIM-barrel fold metal-dependent hydrolase